MRLLAHAEDEASRLSINCPFRAHQSPISWSHRPILGIVCPSLAHHLLISCQCLAISRQHLDITWQHLDISWQHLASLGTFVKPDGPLLLLTPLFQCAPGHSEPACVAGGSLLAARAFCGCP
eukprot:4128497-Pleurochrysis_carterae.AAC.3